MIYLTSILCVGGHVDSVKFSGDFICGLSLLSSRVMRLAVDWQDTPETAPRCSVQREELGSFPEQVDLWLPRQSLYIMKGVWRYHYTHAVLGKVEPNDAAATHSQVQVETERRVSIIFRDALQPDTFLKLYREKDDV